MVTVAAFRQRILHLLRRAQLIQRGEQGIGQVAEKDDGRFANWCRSKSGVIKSGI
jgi:hypothetical protein